MPPPPVPVAAPKYDLKSKSAAELYLDYMDRNGTLPANIKSSDVTRCRRAVEFFNAMATDDEKAQLCRRPGSVGEQAERGVRWTICQEISKAIAAWLAKKYKDQRKDVPKFLEQPAKAKALAVNALQNHYTALGKPEPNRSAFSTFRAALNQPPSARKRSRSRASSPPPTARRSPTKSPRPTILRVGQG